MRGEMIHGAMLAKRHFPKRQHNKVGNELRSRIKPKGANGNKD